MPIGSDCTNDAPQKFSRIGEITPIQCYEDEWLGFDAVVVDDISIEKTVAFFDAFFAENSTLFTQFHATLISPKTLTARLGFDP